MIDFNKIVSDSLHESIQRIIERHEQNKPILADETEQLIRLLLDHSSILLKNYHVALCDELRQQGIHV